MIEYNQIQEDLQTLLSNGTFTDTIKEFFIEGMERDFMLGNMPFINIRLGSANLDLISIPNGYYGTINFKIDIAAMDFTAFSKAAIVRDRIMKEAQSLIQANRAFSANIQTSTVGPGVEFSAGIAELNDVEKGHIASATFDVVVEAYVEPT